MRVVRDRGEARWMPSRHRYALFRLFAAVRLLMAKPESRIGLMLVIDRDQTALEQHVMSLWMWLTTAAFVTDWLTFLPLPIAILLSLPLAAILFQLPMYFVGALVVPLITRRWDTNNHRINAAVMYSLLAIVASRAAMQQTWVRFAGWQYLGILALNAIAAVVVWLLRHRIAALESRFGGMSSVT